MESFARDLATAQAASGDEVLFLGHAPAHQPTSQRDTGNPRLWLARAPWTLSYAPLAPGLPLLFLEALRRFRPDVIHLHAPNPAAAWPLLFGAGLPLVAQWHADVVFPPGRAPWPPLLAAWRVLERRLLARAALVAVSSPAYAPASPALAPFRSKVRTIPLGLDPARLPVPSAETLARARALWPEGGMRVLAVGRLSHYKGFGVLLEALARTPEASLVLAGEGEERAALERLAGDPGLVGRVRLAGAVSDEFLAGLYAACDLFCLPSLDRTEAFGMVLLEAMLAGKPCLVTDIPGSGPVWVVGAGETGLVVPPGDAASLAQAQGTLARDPELRARLGAAGRERFEGHFHISAGARQWSAAYAEALGR
jgi:glycosyltransferase involved in cell wall biosynthesis